MTFQHLVNDSIHLWCVRAYPERHPDSGWIQQQITSALEQLLATQIEPQWISRLPGTKPRLRMPGHEDMRIGYSVSHTEGLLMIAVALGREIGVDVERIRDEPITHELASLVLDRNERCLLGASTNSAAGQLLFHRLWTRKEAVLKACGAGLGVDPSLVHVGWNATDQPCITQLPDGTTWHYVSLPEIDGASIALASDAPIGPILRHNDSYPFRQRWWSGHRRWSSL